MTWPGASVAPFANITETDPQLLDPANGDFRLAPGSPAASYGCQSVRPPISRDANSTIATREPIRLRTRSLMQVGGEILSSEVWDADTIQVISDVIIADGATVHIVAGAVVQFDDYFRITVKGALQAIGIADERILFTSRYSQFFSVDQYHIGAWHGIRFDDPDPQNEPSRLEYCILQYSKATDDETRGGVLSIMGMRKLEVVNCILRNNVADVGGAVYCERYAAPLFSGNLFYQNFALFSGSVFYNNYAYPRIYHNTLAQNEVLNDDTWYRTGTVFNHISKPKMVNNIFWENTSNYYEATEFREIKDFYVNHNTTTYHEGGAGTQSFDPLFMDAGSSDFRLLPSSPCIDAGTLDDPWLVLPTLDLAGNPRIVGLPDMGCYEAGTVSAHEDVPALRKLAIWPNPARVGIGRDGGIWLSLDGSCSSGEEVELSCYDVKGRLVKRWYLSGEMAQNPLRWDGVDADGRSVSSGVYLLKARVDGRFRGTGKLIMIR